MVLSDNKTFTIFPNEENEILIDFFAEQLGMKQKDKTFINSFISWAYEGKEDKEFLEDLIKKLINKLENWEIKKYNLLAMVFLEKFWIEDSNRVDDIIKLFKKEKIDVSFLNSVEENSELFLYIYNKLYNTSYPNLKALKNYLLLN